MKEIISAVFKELSEAPAAIIDAYNKMKKKRAENLESKKEEARGNYEEMSNSISAKSKLEGLNSKTALASMGLNRSGESVQAQLINDMGTKNALADANKQYRSEVQGLEDEHEKQELNAEKELKDELLKVNNKMLDLAENERAAELEREKLELQKQAGQRDEALEREKLALQEDLKNKELALEKEKLEKEKLDEINELKKVIEQYEKDIADLEDEESSDEKEEGYKPDTSAMALYNKILEDSHQGSVWEEFDQEQYNKRVKESIERVLADENLDDEYKASLRLYAYIGGYLQ